MPRRRADPLNLPGTGEYPEDVLTHALPLADTRGQIYVEGRGISAAVAHAAGVRYYPDFAGRPAVIAALYDQHGGLASVHARYLEYARGQDKMLTIGPGGGSVNVLGGWHTDPLIVVEGLFDALSLAMCGYDCVATIGRWVAWLPQVAESRRVWLGFDAGRSGDAEAARYAEHMSMADVRRMLPPGRSKDWNTALVKQGRHTVASWIGRCLEDKA